MNRRLQRVIIIFLLCIAVLSSCAQPAQQGKNESYSEITWQEQYDLGMRYLAESKLSDAILAFKAAIEIEPKRSEAYLGLAQSYYGLGDIDAAIQTVTQGISAVTDTEELEAYLTQLKGVGEQDALTKEADVVEVNEAQKSVLNALFDTMSAEDYVAAAQILLTSSDLLEAACDDFFDDGYIFNGNGMTMSKQTLGIMAERGRGGADSYASVRYGAFNDSDTSSLVSLSINSWDNEGYSVKKRNTEENFTERYSYTLSGRLFGIQKYYDDGSSNYTYYEEDGSYQVHYYAANSQMSYLDETYDASGNLISSFTR